MGRPLRPTSAEVVYHVLNRANARRTLFKNDGDYAACARVQGQACERVFMRLLAYCVMPNLWHLVFWPRRDGDLSRFMNWLTLTHTQRWHQHHQASRHRSTARFGCVDRDSDLGELNRQVHPARATRIEVAEDQS